MSTTGLVDGQPPEHFLPDQFLEEPLEPPHVRGLRVAHATRTRRTIGVVVLFVTVAFGLLVSLAVGSKSIPLGTVIEAFTSYDSAVTDHLIVRDLRLPRTILAVLVGAALGVAGALMQGVTRNPLADPGLLGVNAGAAFAVVLAIWAFDTTEVLGLVWFAFVGAAITSVLVYALGIDGARAGPTRCDSHSPGPHCRHCSARSPAPSRCSTRRHSTSSASGRSARSPDVTPTSPGRSCRSSSSVSSSPSVPAGN